MKSTQRQSLPEEDVLLTRDAFHEAVLARSRGRCVFCPQPAVDAHHILERKLFKDGGYYLGNGAAVCAAHHWQAETTELTVEAVRAAAGVKFPVLPAGLSTSGIYDKWGNQVWPSGLRTWGPLGHDTGARKALAAGAALGLLMPEGYCEGDLATKEHHELD
jgi:hypothetical protein